MVSDIAGTTRDAIDTAFVRDGQHYNIIDTAGIRRKRAIEEESIERYSIVRALTAVRRCDVALIVINAEEGVTEQDTKVARYVHEEGKAAIAAIKADCAEGNMAQTALYHTGSFRVESEYSEDGYAQFMELSISISGNDSSWWICVYPDSIHTLQWLESHGALGVEVMAENIRHG